MMPRGLACSAVLLNSLELAGTMEVTGGSGQPCTHGLCFDAKLMDISLMMRLSWFFTIYVFEDFL
jgi:hypothetical protein